jgi:hypothetical protein
MILSNEQLKEIIAAGGGVVIDASDYPFLELQQLVAAAPVKNANITLKNLSNLTAAQLKTLAVLAPGLLNFDLSTPSKS